MTANKGLGELSDFVERLRNGALTVDDAVSAAVAKSLARQADGVYIKHANQQAYASLKAGQSDLALVWARAAQAALDYLRPPGKNLLLRFSRRITSAVGLHDGVVAYSEYIAGVAALHLGRYEEAKVSLLRAQSIAQYNESAGSTGRRPWTLTFTAADCARVLGRFPT